MCVSLGRAIRDRLLGDAPARAGSGPSASFRLALSKENGSLTDGSTPDAAEMGELERSVAAFIQAQELLGSEATDVALWRLAEAEHAKTLLIHAELLSNSLQANFSTPEPLIHRSRGPAKTSAPTNKHEIQPIYAPSTHGMAPPWTQFTFISNEAHINTLPVIRIPISPSADSYLPIHAALSCSCALYAAVTTER